MVRHSPNVSREVYLEYWSCCLCLNSTWYTSGKFKTCPSEMYVFRINSRVVQRLILDTRSVLYRCLIRIFCPFCTETYSRYSVGDAQWIIPDIPFLLYGDLFRIPRPCCTVILYWREIRNNGADGELTVTYLFLDPPQNTAKLIIDNLTYNTCLDAKWMPYLETSLLSSV